ncbi:hypothetical protein D9611_014298 [Ephemerocybe angulata]|uniref:Helitron helicase-like domain-containing protein n=1 Tax=Ephemerocybe angulata TaxID=980116 RepID=A0A8H5F9W9_9AGAR|nr:hypothetical protein D9611_014298 [Tulosesus angulatus]
MEDVTGFWWMETMILDLNPPNLRDLRKILRQYISRLKKAKRTFKSTQAASAADLEAERNVLRDTWPQLVTPETKQNLINAFNAATSSQALSSFTCALCAESQYNRDRTEIRVADTDLSFLRAPKAWFDPLYPTPPLPYSEGPLANMFIDERANRNYLGDIPAELKDLTFIEEAIVARCRAKMWILQLKEGLPSEIAQRGFHGNIIVYPQRPSSVTRILPPTVDEIITPICVLFIGSTPPTYEWLRTKAKPLVVRREKIRAALDWLKSHNPLYKDVIVSGENLNSLPEDDVLPVHIEHIQSTSNIDELTSRYDDPPSTTDTSLHAAAVGNDNNDSVGDSAPISFQNVVIADVEGTASPEELRAAASRHIKNGGAYLEIPHDSEPVNEFNNPTLFPMIYPTLFPYGCGGLEDRRAALLHTNLKMKRSKLHSLSHDFATVSPETIETVVNTLSEGKQFIPRNNEEKKVLKLMNEVRAITTHVPGSCASRTAMRNEIRGMIMEKGLPSFYITLNPADVYNPVVKFLAGSEINIDELLPEQVPDYWEQAKLVARNPFLAAKFFDMYINSFFSSLLQYSSKPSTSSTGILGVVNGYYGCVEAQGRGTLHCHMLIWLEGAHDPTEIRDRILKHHDTAFQERLIAFLDDTISNSIPPDPGADIHVPSCEHNPCSVRSVKPPSASSSDSTIHEYTKMRLKDLHNLVHRCQVHTHSHTCYKYWKPGEPRECRFNLSEDNTHSETTFDEENGYLRLRHLDGLVNNFNETIIEAMRCNMDIKFVGSGEDAKAVIYYITNYITKTQLKTHVAYAALELATQKLEEFNPTEDDITLRAKRLLQKCAYGMLSHQELSAQQVASYLMDYGDHYTSDKYQQLFWTSFENFIDKEQPSPECYRTALDTAIEPTTANSDSDSEHDDDDDDDEADENDERDEVTVSRDPTTGHLVAKAQQVIDYQLRPQDLASFNVWDYIRLAEKCPVKQEPEALYDHLDTNDDDDVPESLLAAITQQAGAICIRLTPTTWKKNSPMLRLPT